MDRKTKITLGVFLSILVGLMVIVGYFWYQTSQQPIQPVPNQSFYLCSERSMDSSKAERNYFIRKRDLYDGIKLHKHKLH